MDATGNDPYDNFDPTPQRYTGPPQTVPPQTVPEFGQPAPAPPILGYIDTPMPGTGLSTEYLTPPPPAPQRSRKRLIGVVAAAAVVLAVAATGAYAYSALSGGGTQPEQVLPASTVAFAKIDLNPAANQKIAVYQLSRKFPTLGKSVTSQKNVKDDPLQGFLAHAGIGLDYTRDVKPWLGDRAAIAAVPDAGTVDEVFALQVTDQAKMKAAIAKLRAANGQQIGATSIKNFVLLSDTQAHSDAAAAAAKNAPLSSDSTFSRDVASLPGDQLAESWVNADKLWSLVPVIARHYGTLKSGRLVLGLHASSGYLEIAGFEHGAGAATKVPAASMTMGLPADTKVAFEATGLSSRFSEIWSAMPAAMRNMLDGEATQSGLNLSGDLSAMLGDDLTLSMPPGSQDQPPVGVQVKTSQPARALASVNRLLSMMGSGPGPLMSSDLHASATPNGFVVGNDPDYLSKLASNTGPRLGTDSLFERAVPHASGASVIAFVKVHELMSEMGASATAMSQWGHLAAVGVSISPTTDGSSFDLRAVVQ